MIVHPIRYHRPLVHIPAKRAPLVLALGVGGWLALAALGHGFWLLLTFVAGQS